VTELRTAAARAPAPVTWQIATISSIRPETPTVTSYTFRLPAWRPHRSGQHYDVRLTAKDGYQAERSYSIASEPARVGEIDLTIERVPDGEVSGFFHEIAMVGDRIELRGPIGGYFTWQPSPRPLLLVGGGSGVVPLMAMLRDRAASGSTARARLLYSAREPDEVIYAEELERLAAEMDGFERYLTFTRRQPPGWTGFARRIDREMLRDVAAPLGTDVDVFVCGPTRLVEAVANTLEDIGIAGARIRTERFGPTGS
jgi:ferredoxin-NADP reductase